MKFKRSTGISLFSNGIAPPCLLPSNAMGGKQKSRVSESARRDSTLYINLYRRVFGWVLDYFILFDIFTRQYLPERGAGHNQRYY
jgi:hypothetical protein